MLLNADDDAGVGIATQRLCALLSVKPQRMEFGPILALHCDNGKKAQQLASVCDATEAYRAKARKTPILSSLSIGPSQAPTNWSSEPGRERRNLLTDT